MTERSRGAPDPAEPSMSGTARISGNVVSAGDLNAVRRTDAIFDALASRRTATSPAADDGEGTALSTGLSTDPALQLLSALVADVDAGSGADTGATTDTEAELGGDRDGAETAGTGEIATPGLRRRGPRTIVALGVAGVVLASTGVAAAGGGFNADQNAPAPVKPGVSGEKNGSKADDTRDGTATSGDGSPAARPVPSGHERPQAKGGPAVDPVRQQIEDLKNRLEGLVPPSGKPRPQQPGGWPFQQPQPRAEPDDQTQRRIDDIRRQAQKRLDRYRDGHGD